MNTNKSELILCSRNTYQEKYMCKFQVNDPALYRNLGKYQLPHIRGNILQDTTQVIQPHPIIPY